MIDYSEYYREFKKSYKDMSEDEKGELLCFILYIHIRNTRVQDFNEALMEYKRLANIEEEKVLQKFVSYAQGRT